MPKAPGRTADNVHPAGQPSKSERVVQKASARNLRTQAKLVRACERATDNDANRAIIRTLSGLDNPLPVFVASNAALENALMASAFTELSAARSRSGQEFASLRIEDASWSGPLESLHLDVGAVRSAAWRVLSAAAPNFLAQIVLSDVEGEVDCSDKPHIRWRVEAIIWGSGIQERVDAAVTKYRSRFRQTEPGRNPLAVRLLPTSKAALADAIAEAWSYPPILSGGAALAKDGKTNTGHRATRARRRLLLFRLLSMIDLKRTTLAGGAGKAIKNRMALEGTELLKRSRTGPQALHPEGIAHFWFRTTSAVNGINSMPLVTYGKAATQQVQSARPRKKN